MNTNQRHLSFSVIALGLSILFTGFARSAEPTSPFEERFDTLEDGPISNQDGWVSPSYANSLALIQSAVNANVGGKALELKYPAGIASKEISGDALSGIIAVDFKLFLPGKVDGKDGKFILTLKSSEGQVVTSFFHDSDGRWGMGTDGSYAFASDSTPPEGWRLLRVLVNFNEKRVSVFEGFGQDWTPLFPDHPFMDTSASNIKSVTVQNHEQGAEASVFVDDIVIHLNPKTDLSARETLKSILEVATPDEPESSIFESGKAVNLVFRINRPEGTFKADHLAWSVRDWNNKEIEAGSLQVSDQPSWQGSVDLKGLKAGCYYVMANLKDSGASLPARGSRPAGMATFGVLPDLPIQKLEFPEQSRFGVHGLNDGADTQQDPFALLYDKLGAHWTEIRRSWHEFEPNFAGQFTALAEWQIGGHVTPYPDYPVENYTKRQLVPIMWVVGVPDWASSRPPGAKGENGQGFAIKDLDAYAAFLKKVATQQAEYRKKYFPYLRHSYYNITHEPDWHWKGNDADFIAIYKTAHQALHEGDSEAILLGPRYGVLNKGLEHLERLLPMGLGKYLDGLDAHAYYLPPHLGNSPEKANTARDFRRLRELADKYIRPDAFMMQGEWGVRYEQSFYGREITPELLKEHALQFVQGHLIALGEGCDATFFFYTHDYKSEAGYGMNFSLTMTDSDTSDRWSWMHDRSINSSAVSPKPTFMAAAAMVRLLEGTKTLGSIASGPEITAYRFKRNTDEIVVIWAGEAVGSGEREITIQANPTSFRVFDMMGNEISLPVAEKADTSTLRIGREPLYIVSNENITFSFRKA